MQQDAPGPRTEGRRRPPEAGALGADRGAGPGAADRGAADRGAGLGAAERSISESDR